MSKGFELRLCSNGTYYVYENGVLTDVDFDKFNKESADALIDKVNALYEEKEQLRKENDMFSCELSVSANKEISRNCRIAELEEENKQLKQAYNDAKKNVEKKEQILKEIMEDNLLIQDMRNELKE